MIDTKLFCSLPFACRYAKLKITIPQTGNMVQGLKNVECRPHQISAAIRFRQEHSPAEIDAAIQHMEQLKAGQQSKLYTASHLCQEERCSAKGHVILESQMDNGRRQNCLVEVSCDCGKKISVCPSLPKCLKKAKWLR